MSERIQQLYRERIAYFVFMRFWFTILTMTDLEILEVGGGTPRRARRGDTPES